MLAQIQCLDCLATRIRSTAETECRACGSSKLVAIDTGSGVVMRADGVEHIYPGLDDIDYLPEGRPKGLFPTSLAWESGG